MKQRRKTSLIAASLLLCSLAASAALLHRIDQIRPQATLDEVLYVRSPKALKRASLGYDGLLACVYWTRTVQYFGRHHQRSVPSFSELGPLLEITTALDPHLVVAYQFGASFLAPPAPNGAGEPDRAIALMKYGIQNNPLEWHLYYDLGFIYYMDLKDYADAADAFTRGAQAPNAHPFLKVLAAQMAQHAGEFNVARTLWLTTYESSRDSMIRQNAIEHLRDLKVDEDITHLEAAVTRFGEKTGRLPVSMTELMAAEGWRGVPVDPDGKPYRLDAEGRILLQQPDDFPLATKGMPPGYHPVVKFHDH